MNFRLGELAHKKLPVPNALSLFFLDERIVQVPKPGQMRLVRKSFAPPVLLVGRPILSDVRVPRPLFCLWL